MRGLDDGEKYVASVYWALTTMSTIGYGDIVPTNTPERLITMVVMVMGTAIYAYGITSVITNMSGIDQLRQKARHIHLTACRLTRRCSM
jgi:hypothetical protein